MLSPPEKRPRQYAVEILRLRTAQQRRDALALAPEHLQALTARHVTEAMRKARERSPSRSPSPASPRARGGTECAS